MGNNQSQAQNKECLKILQRIEKIIFDLDENNITESVESSLEFFEEESPYSFNLIVCRLVYSFLLSHFQNANIYFTYLKFLEEKEKANDPNISNIIEVFAKFLISIETHESNYLLENLVEQNFIEAKTVKNKSTLYFAHYQTDIEPNDINTKLPFSGEFIENFEALKKDDWKLHKQLVKEGVNPSDSNKEFPFSSEFFENIESLKKMIGSFINN